MNKDERADSDSRSNSHNLVLFHIICNELERQVCNVISLARMLKMIQIPSALQDRL